MRAFIVAAILLTLVGFTLAGPSDDEFEPNDTCGESTPNVVQVGAEWSLYMNTDNEDWFEFEFPVGGPLTIQTAKGFNLPYCSNTIIEIYDGTCEELIAFNDDIDFSEGDLYSAVHLDLVPYTTVNIRVRSGDPELPAGSYRLECYYGVVGSEESTLSGVKSLYR